MVEVHTQQSGRLEDVSPLDLLQSLGIYRRAGHVVFLHPYGRSRLWFEAGAIVDAESGALRGTAAVYRIATHDRGEYRVEVTGQARRRMIERSGSGLIFEAARRLDEGQRLRVRLPAAEAVLARAEAAVIDGPTEEHARVAGLFEAGVTLGEVLERSGLGELETLQWIGELVEAGKLRPTGAMRSPEPPASDGLAEPTPWQPGLEPSQPFVPSPSFAGPEGFDDPAPGRRRWWIHASVGAAVAAAVTLAIAWGSADGSTTEGAASLLVGSGSVTVIDATTPSIAQPDEPAPPEHGLVVGASATVQTPAHDHRAEIAVAPSRSTAGPSGKHEVAREPGRAARSRSDAAPSVRSEPRAEPAAAREDATALLIEARRAYAAGRGATAYRLATRSQQLRPTADAAELMTLAACQQQRPEAAAEALRAVPLLRRGSVRATCKQAHGVRIKTFRGGR